MINNHKKSRKHGGKDFNDEAMGASIKCACGSMLRDARFEGPRKQSSVGKPGLRGRHQQCSKNKCEKKAERV